MPVEVRVPALGESVLEATVGGWLKSEGDAVVPGDPLVELETEKVAVEVTADEAGVLEQIVHREGDTVHVGDVLAVLANGAGVRQATTPAPVTAAAAPERQAEPSPPAAAGEAPGVSDSAPGQPAP